MLGTPACSQVVRIYKMNADVHYPVYKSPPNVPTLNDVSSVPKLPSYFSKNFLMLESVRNVIAHGDAWEGK